MELTEVANANGFILFEYMEAKPLYLEIIRRVGWQKGPKPVLLCTKITWKKVLIEMNVAELQLYVCQNRANIHIHTYILPFFLLLHKIPAANAISLA